MLRSQIPLETYICPDCGWNLRTRAHRIRCGNCGSLNLERQLPDGRLIKADADEYNPDNAKSSIPNFSMGDHHGDRIARM